MKRSIIHPNTILLIIFHIAHEQYFLHLSFKQSF